MAVTTKGQVDDYKSISSKEIKDVIESLFEPRETAHFEKQKYEIKESSNIFTFEYFGINIAIEETKKISLLESKPIRPFVIKKYGVSKSFEPDKDYDRIKYLLDYFKEQQAEELGELRKEENIEQQEG